VGFLGTIHGPKDVSAIAPMGDHLEIRSDEVRDNRQLIRRVDSVGIRSAQAPSPAPYRLLGK
jgi:hypothetical protein